MGIDLHLSTCVDTQSPKYLEMAQGHISLSLLMTRARVSGLVVPWLVEEGLLLLVVDHHPLSLRIHLFGRLVP
jgi:hypothetical protein